MSQVAALRRPVEERFGNSSGHVGGGSRKKWVKERECGGQRGGKPHSAQCLKAQDWTSSSRTQNR